MTTATLLNEIHTGDLTASCPRSVYLRHNGQIVRLCGEAMYKGQLCHKALEYTHRFGLWHSPRTAVERAAMRVTYDLKTEGRTMTDSCSRHLDEYNADVLRWVTDYALRFADEFRAAKLIGVEVPCRLSLEIDGKPQEFASHMDLVFIDQHGQTCVWDWKTQEEAPTRAYLDRNLQLAMYSLCMSEGEIMVDGEWRAEYAQPVLSWVHIRHLAPYAKACEQEDDSGVKRAFAKGDPRPRHRIVQDILHIDEAAMREELACKVRMFRAGLFPTNPSPIGCMTCDSLQYCGHFCKESQ